METGGPSKADMTRLEVAMGRKMVVDRFVCKLSGWATRTDQLTNIFLQINCLCPGTPTLSDATTRTQFTPTATHRTQITSRTRVNKIDLHHPLIKSIS